MALSRKKPKGYPEISFLSFDVLGLLADVQEEMGLSGIGPVTFSLQTMETLACIYCQPGRLGGDICFHSLFNRPDVPQPVIEHVLRHELLHLKIPPREIDGKLIIHPPRVSRGRTGSRSLEVGVMGMDASRLLGSLEAGQRE